MNRDSYIAIAGGAGYIGSQANRELCRRGFRTVIIDNLSAGHAEFARWGQFHRCDLNDRDGLESVFSAYPIAAVMHFSAFTYVGESVADPQKYYRNNVANTLNLLQVMMEHDVKRFIFSSSCAVYGDPVAVPMNETHPYNPLSPYGRSKLMVERILADYSAAYDLNYVSLRYFNAAGADPDCETGEWHEPETHLIPLVLDAALGKRRDVEIYGTDYETDDGTCVRDYIHIADLADAHIRALEYLDGGGRSQAFNLGNGSGFSVRDVIDTSRKVTGSPIAVRETARRPGDPAALVSDSARARAVLGWEPGYTRLEEIIETAWKWHRKLYRDYKK